MKSTIKIPKEFVKHLPEIPVISETEIIECKKNKNFMPIAFKWAKFCGIMTIKFASISIDSRSIKRDVDTLYITIIQGLLNRCSRLLMSILHLASANKFDETIRIIFRCLIETAIKIEWLCIKGNKESFEMYIADGLKSDLELKKIIKNNVRKRDNQVLKIENRMLKSINNCVKISGMNPDQITNTKKMPNFFTICQEAGYDEQTYITFQRMGSHSIHGTFTDLLFHYLEEKNGELTLKNGNIKPKETYVTNPSIFLTTSLEKYASYIFTDSEIVDELKSFLENIRMEILKYYHASLKPDFEFE